MPKSLRNPRLGEFISPYPMLTSGAVWGALIGAAIGASISLSIGLFYSSASLLIFSVIVASSILGGLFGHVMAGLLNDDLVLTWRASGYDHVYSPVLSSVELSDHRGLRAEKGIKIISNQDVMAKVNTIRIGNMAASGYHSDARVFELIVATAHKMGARTHL